MNRCRRLSRRSHHLKIVAALVVAWHATASESRAVPYRPSDPEEVIETVPDSLRGNDGKEFSALRAAVEAKPDDREAALRFSRLSIQRGRALSDPRFFGYAEAVIEAQLKRRSSDSDFLVLRGIVRQRRHDFEAAKQDLQRALKKSPENPQAWAVLATIQIVTADFSSARSSCAHLLSTSSALAAASCLSLASGLNGGAAEAYQALEAELHRSDASGSPNKGEQIWAMSILAEIAERLGHKENAERWYRKTIEASPDDAFTLAAFADFLIAGGRFAEAQRMLQGKESVDPLLLRLVIAEKALKAEEFERHRGLLDSRFQAEEQRGESIHARERAHFELDVQGNPQHALRFAEKNWEQQKEAIDFLLLARAAVGARDEERIARVREWMQANTWQDVRAKVVLEGVRE